MCSRKMQTAERFARLITEIVRRDDAVNLSQCDDTFIDSRDTNLNMAPPRVKQGADSLSNVF